MSIVSRLINRPQSFSIEMLQEGVENGTIPAYIGIPLIQEKLQDKKEMQGASAAAMMGQQRQLPVAERVMAEAAQVTQAPQEMPRGIERLRSNLPTEYAQGGIVSFAEGGSSSRMAKMLLDDDEEADDDYIEAIMDVMDDLDEMRSRMSDVEAPEPVAAPEDGGIAAIVPMASVQSREGITVKREGEPAKTVEHKTSSVAKPKGLEDLLALVEQKESGGRRYDKYGRVLTSPKGAMGEMQVMPGTARDPGFGIRPAREGDLEDLARVGREYYAKMLERYNDPKIAAIAYNWGPGNTDRWLAAGADPRALPEETRNYAQGFAEGGLTGVQRFQFGGVAGMTAVDLMGLSLEDVLRMARMGEPGAAEELARRQGLRGVGPARMGDAAARVAAQAAPAAAPAAPAATAAAPVAQGSTMIDRLGRVVGRVATPAKAAGVLGLLGTPANAAEETRAQQEAELARRRKMAPTIDVPAGVLLSEFPGVQQEAGAPPRMEKPQPISQTYSRTQGATAEDLARMAREAGFSETREQEDLDLGVAMQRMAEAAGAEKAEPAKEAAAAKEPDSIAKLRAQIEASRAGSSKQKEIDKYMALLQAGLGIMGGQSPYASQNIGRGAMAGIQAYQEAAKQRGAEERALLGAELGLERYSQLANLQREQAAARKTYQEAETARKREATQQGITQRQAELTERQRKNLADQLNEYRRVFQQQALAQYKGEMLPDKKEQVFAQAEAQLNADPAYRQLYKRVYGFEPPGAILTYDPTKRALR